jgi:hypothetical protein
MRTSGRAIEGRSARKSAQRRRPRRQQAELGYRPQESEQEGRLLTTLERGDKAMPRASHKRRERGQQHPQAMTAGSERRGAVNRGHRQAGAQATQARMQSVQPAPALASGLRSAGLEVGRSDGSAREQRVAKGLQHLGRVLQSRHPRSQVQAQGGATATAAPSIGTEQALADGRAGTAVQLLVDEAMRDEMDALPAPPTAKALRMGIEIQGDAVKRIQRLEEDRNGTIRQSKGSASYRHPQQHARSHSTPRPHRRWPPARSSRKIPIARLPSNRAAARSTTKGTKTAQSFGWRVGNNSRVLRPYTTIFANWLKRSVIGAGSGVAANTAYFATSSFLFYGAFSCAFEAMK